MPTTTRSRLGDALGSQSFSGSSDSASRLVSSVHGGLKDAFVRGLKDIFQSFVTQPDFHRHYERDIALRLYRPWHRVGNSMRLALGKPIRLTVTYPDGQRTTHVVDPEFADDAYRTAVRHAQESVEDSDELMSADHAAVFLTRKQSDELAAHVRRK